VIQSPQTPADADTVRRALISAWQRAADWELDSVATPLVGTGAGQLSIEEAAQLLEQTSRASRFPSRLLIVVNSETERTTVEAVVTRHPS